MWPLLQYYTRIEINFGQVNSNKYDNKKSFEGASYTCLLIKDTNVRILEMIVIM